MKLFRFLLPVVVALLVLPDGGAAARAGAAPRAPEAAHAAGQSPTADPIWLHFDDLASATRIDDEYAASSGLHFLNDWEADKTFRGSPQILAVDSPYSSPNVLLNSYYDSEMFNSTDVPLVFWSDSALSGVGMQLSTTMDWCAPTATISLYDCNGFLRGEGTAQVSSRGYTPIEVDVDDAAHPAQVVVVDYGATQCPELIDDLAVQPVSGACQDFQAPLVTITSHGDSEVVNNAHQILQGYVTETGILKSVKVNGAAAQVYYSDGFYYFTKHVTLKDGANTLTAVAEDGSGGKGSDQVVLTLGVPVSASLGQFHLTQRGVMKNASCDVDVPFVAGKSTLARVNLQVKTASGLDTYASSVQLKLWRKASGGDQLVNTYWGTTYSPYVSQFNSPDSMGAVHFWIPGEDFETAGSYKFEFRAYADSSQIGSALVPNCGGSYYTFTETDSVRPYLLPFEAGSLSQYLQGTDYAKYLATQMDNLERIFPVRDGYAPVWYTVPAGVYYAEGSPLRLCDGSAKAQSTYDYCDGTGYRWTFVDHSGTLTRAHATGFTVDSSFANICGGTADRNLGGQVASAKTFSYSFTAGLGVFRPGAHMNWMGAKHAMPLDANGDGDLDISGSDLSDLQRVAAEYRDGSTWSTNWAGYTTGDVFRMFRDQNGDNCNEFEITAWSFDGVPTYKEPQADVRYLFDMWHRALEWEPLKAAYDAHNQALAGTSRDAVRPAYTLPIPLVAPAEFHAVGGGNSAGGYSWIKVEHSAVLAHELGHTYKLQDLYLQSVDPAKDDLVTKENAWIVYVRYKSYDPTKVFALMARGVADIDVMISKNYATVFYQLMASAAAASKPADDGPQFVIGGQIFGGDQLLNARTALADGLEPTPVVPESYYRLVFGAAGILAEVPFLLELPNGPEDDPTAGPPPDAGPAQTPLYFHVVAPYPEGTEWVDLYAGEQVLARFAPSATPPQVTLTEPNGGLFGPYDQVPIRWEAGDADGDRLLYTITYSPDGGERWIVVASGLIGHEYLWNLGDVPGTPEGNGRLSIVASDGFHSAGDQSDEPIAVGGKPPTAVILGPARGERFMQCERVRVRGVALDPEGRLANVTWFLDGAALDAELEADLGRLPPGRHELRLQALDMQELLDEDMVEVDVVPDADCDGMPDEFELLYALELSLADDASLDGDEDQLINFDEARIGTAPNNPDSDGDGWPDGEEVAAGSNPLDPGSFPRQAERVYLPLVERGR